MDRKWITMRCIVCPMHAEVFWYMEAMYFTVPQPEKSDRYMQVCRLSL